uniref:Uncharacterized protein n=1 Tax=Anopheles christyi TaxID=43041 RepID=A0A182K1C2_9DIPT
MAPMYATMDEPEHQASNLVAQVVVIPNGSEGHIPQGPTATTTEKVEMLNTPCALKSELEQSTDPPVLITPRSNRSTKREKDRKRKSRSKSHSSRMTSTDMPTQESTAITMPITTPEVASVTESLSPYDDDDDDDDVLHYDEHGNDNTKQHYSDNIQRDFLRQNIATNRHITSTDNRYVV